MSHTDIATHNGITLRVLHSPDKTKVFGYLTGLKQADNSLHDLQKHDYQIDGEERLDIFVPVDRVNDIIIRKHVSLDRCKVFGYVNVGPDTTLRFATLREARQAAGFIEKPTKETLPKRMHAQNAPGYRADAQKAGKK